MRGNPPRTPLWTEAPSLPDRVQTEALRLYRFVERALCAIELRVAIAVVVAKCLENPPTASPLGRQAEILGLLDQEARAQHGLVGVRVQEEDPEVVVDHV